LCDACVSAINIEEVVKSGGKPAKKLKTGAEAEHALVEKAAIIATIFGLCVTRQISKCTSQVMLTNKLKNDGRASWEAKKPPKVSNAALAVGGGFVLIVRQARPPM
jgi:hypothetical protein